jgi:hypothetical protein
MGKDRAVDSDSPREPEPKPPAEPSRRRRNRKPLTDAEKAAAAIGGIVSTTPTV